MIKCDICNFNSFVCSCLIRTLNCDNWLSNTKINLTIGDKFEFEKLNQITLALKDNYESKMSNAELKRLLESIKSEWLQQGYSDDSKYGNVLATTLAVSLASLEWWEDKPEAIGSGTKVVPVWVGADVGGAIVGSVVAGINSYALNGEVNWKSVGLGAAGGAITGSTGVVGKLGKWISNVF